ncbi:MAG TPA: hypothetical protein VGJ51_19090 [Candidatus Angelobacter sp.]
MWIQNWEITSGQRTFDLRFIKHALMAVFLVAVATGLHRLMGQRYPTADAVIALLAGLFAAIQFIDARLQKHEMDRIAKTMSTRYIGLFPKNLTEIAEVVGKAGRNVCIMTDFVSYGHYSFPAAFAKYLNKIKEASEREANVRIICYNRQLSEKEIEDQLPDREFGKERDSERFQGYFRKIYRGVSVPQTGAELRAFLAGCHKKYSYELQEKGVKLAYLSERCDFFLWLEDDEEAVFAFKNVGAKRREICFRTKDTNLIGQFRQIFERRWQTADCVYDPSRGGIAVIRSAGTPPKDPAA